MSRKCCLCQNRRPSVSFDRNERDVRLLENGNEIERNKNCHIKIIRIIAMRFRSTELCAGTQNNRQSLSTRTHMYNNAYTHTEYTETVDCLMSFHSISWNESPQIKRNERFGYCRGERKSIHNNQYKVHFEWKDIEPHGAIVDHMTTFESMNILSLHSNYIYKTILY